MSEKTPPAFRAKVTVDTVLRQRFGETLKLKPVYGKSVGSGKEQHDEDNTYSAATPSGSIELFVTNPALIGQLNPGDTFYVDFTPIPVPAEAAP